MKKLPYALAIALGLAMSGTASWAGFEYGSGDLAAPDTIENPVLSQGGWINPEGCEACGRERGTGDRTEPESLGIHREGIVAPTDAPNISLER